MEVHIKGVVPGEGHGTRCRFAFMAADSNAVVALDSEESGFGRARFSRPGN